MPPSARCLSPGSTAPSRATRYPRYFDFSVVRVEDDPHLSADAPVKFADEALAGLAHRRVDFEVVAAAEPLRAGFEGSPLDLWVNPAGARLLDQGRPCRP
jgi:hypothetical protein